MNQKLISKKDDKPTPSQPTNICKKLLLVTKISIKKVNSDKYDINRGRCGSSDIYSIEYKCTKLEMKVTTNNITPVSLSNKKINKFLFHKNTLNHKVALQKQNLYLKE